jgi:phosphoribosylformylglycinamidine synthase
MKSALATSAALERITLTSRAPDPREPALLGGAGDLGISGIRRIEVSDMVFLQAALDDAARRTMHELLVDPLLQHGAWESSEYPPTVAPDRHVIESALLPGVTDPVAGEIARVAAREGVMVAGVATGRRFVVHARLTAEELHRLAGRLLANPIIERWAIDEPIEPSFVPTTGEMSSHAERLAFDATATLESLHEINKSRGLALDPAELLAIRDHFVARGRLPTDVEVETIAQTWSEHCSHKTFRAKIVLDGVERESTMLGQLRASTTAIARDFVVSAFDGNAGVVRFDAKRTYALKCETHNHPSAVEPFGGANTGVGGVIRDVLGADHDPIAVTDILCFGEPDTKFADLPEGTLHPRRVRDGVVAGVADYGNKIGLPTIAGAVFYDRGYAANPLVYAGCIGVASDWRPAQVPQPGDRCIVLGGRTGRDGIRGATFSSMTMDATTGDVAGASVQIGDPIVEKLLMDVLRESRGLYRSITDCGAGGLSSAIGELADGVGAHVDVARVPLKYPGLSAWEVWLSEAQERMVVAVDPRNLDAFCAVCERHGVEATDVGSFTGDKMLRVAAAGTVVLELDTEFLHDGRPQRRLDAIAQRPDRAASEHVPEAVARRSLGELLLALLAHPNIASKAGVIRRYDHEIRGATLQRPLVGVHADAPGDGSVLVEPGEDSGIAVGIGVSPFTGEADAQRMAWLAVDEAIRNAVAVGADPRRIALLDNFSWGDPRRATTLGQLVAAVDGCVDAAQHYASPFVSGKDSLNNEWVDRDATRRSVPPTLVVTAVAHVPDARRVIGSAARKSGDLLCVVGRVASQWNGSHAARVCATSGRVVPEPDRDAAARYEVLHRLILNGTIVACHDVSEGGLAVAVAEMLIGGRLGAHAENPSAASASAGIDMHTWWFAESAGRLVLEIAPGELDRVRAAFGADDVSVVATLTDDDEFAIAGERIALDDMVSAFCEVAT